MDSFELNKILGAVLGTCIVVLVMSFTAGSVFSAKQPEKPGFEIAVKEESHGGGGEAAAAAADTAAPDGAAMTPQQTEETPTAMAPAH